MLVDRVCGESTAIFFFFLAFPSSRFAGEDRHEVYQTVCVTTISIIVDCIFIMVNMAPDGAYQMKLSIATAGLVMIMYARCSRLLSADRTSVGNGVTENTIDLRE